MGCEKREIVFRSPDFLCRSLFIPKKEHKAPFTPALSSKYILEKTQSIRLGESKHHG